MQNVVYDVLHTVPPEDAMQFTVVADSDALEVALTAIGGSFARCYNSDNAPFFKPGDNLLLQFIKVNLPFGFGQGTGVHHIGLKWIAEDNSEQDIPELAQNSLIDMGCACDGIQFPGGGLFLQTPTTGEKLWGLAFKTIALNVSMVNVPSVLVGETLEAGYYLGVSHTLPMEFGS